MTAAEENALLQRLFDEAREYFILRDELDRQQEKLIDAVVRAWDAGFSQQQIADACDQRDPRYPEWGFHRTRVQQLLKIARQR